MTKRCSRPTQVTDLFSFWTAHFFKPVGMNIPVSTPQGLAGRGPGICSHTKAIAFSRTKLWHIRRVSLTLTPVGGKVGMESQVCIFYSKTARNARTYTSYDSTRVYILSFVVRVVVCEPRRLATGAAQRHADSWYRTVLVSTRWHHSHSSQKDGELALVRGL